MSCMPHDVNTPMILIPGGWKYFLKMAPAVCGGAPAHREGTLKDTLSCFIYSKGIQEGTFATFFPF